MDETIQSLEDILRDLPDDDISGPVYWNQLGKLLIARYSFLQSFEDLQYATEVHQKAVDKAIPVEVRGQRHEICGRID
jgi:hypothetical protein